MKHLLFGAAMVLSQFSFAGYALVNGMPSSSVAVNAAMGAALADKLATLKVNAQLGAQIMRTVARSSAVRFLGKSVVLAAPLMMAADTGVFDEQTPGVLVHGDGASITLSGPSMDMTQMPSRALPSSSLVDALMIMGYPNDAVFANRPDGDMAIFLRTKQYACPTPNTVCNCPRGTLDGSGYSVSACTGLGYIGDNHVYQLILIMEKNPPKLLKDLRYQPRPITTNTTAASDLPDSRANDQVNPALVAAALSSAIDDARQRAPGLAWPPELSHPNSISAADIKATGVSTPLSGALAPIAVGSNDQAPAGWADARPGTPYWDPSITLPGTWGGTGTTTNTGTGSQGTTVDLGTAPTVAEPQLENMPTGLQIMQPVIDALNPLKGMSLPSGDGQCPTVDLDLSFFREGAVHHLDEQCAMFEKVRPILEPVFAACWGLMAFFIVLRA